MPSPFDGHWKIVYSCRATTHAKDRCENDANDYVDLRLWTHDDDICGFHDATTHLQNRTDNGADIDGEPSLLGKVRGNSAAVKLRTTRSETEEVDATLRVAEKNYSGKSCNLDLAHRSCPNMQF